MYHHWIDQSHNEAQCPCGASRHRLDHKTKELFAYTLADGTSADTIQKCTRPHPIRESVQLDAFIGKNATLKVGLHSDGGILIPRGTSAKVVGRTKFFLVLATPEGRKISKALSPYLELRSHES